MTREIDNHGNGYLVVLACVASSVLCFVFGFLTAYYLYRVAA